LKSRVLFVGAFREGGKVKGGQQTACQSLVRSPLNEHVEWTLLDTTMESLPPPPFQRRLWLAVLRLIRFARLLLGRRFDRVVIFTSSGASFVEKGLMGLASEFRGIPTILCPRSGHLLDDLRKGGITRWFIQTVLGRMSYVLCQGQSWRDLFQQLAGLPSARLPIIPNWIEVGDLASLPSPRFSGRFTVLMMGWLETNKGIFDLVAAAKDRRKDLTHVRFLICGRGSQAAALQEAINAAGLADQFELRGWVDGAAKQQAIAESDILALLSYREGFPNAILEAMAAGRAVLATKVGAIPEVIRHGATGALCEAGNVQEIGCRLVEMTNRSEETARMAGAARRHVFEHHDLAQTWRRWLPLLAPQEQLNSK